MPAPPFLFLRTRTLTTRTSQMKLYYPLCDSQQAGKWTLPGSSPQALPHSLGKITLRCVWDLSWLPKFLQWDWAQPSTLIAGLITHPLLAALPSLSHFFTRIKSTVCTWVMVCYWGTQTKAVKVFEFCCISKFLLNITDYLNAFG